jgi:transposase
MLAMLCVRPLTQEEARQVQLLAASRTEPARAVERAQIVLLSSQQRRVSTIAQRLGLCQQTVRLWIKRFNDRGLAGLADAPRSGHPTTYSAEVVGEVIATSLTDPQTLGLPFASWTLDRLEAYLNEEKRIPIKRTRIDDFLLAEGLRWRQQETWFGARPDPAFAQKRARSSPFIRSHRQAAS